MPIKRVSLRLKLTLWYLAVFLTIYAFVAIAGWLLHRDAVRRSIDHRLEELAVSVAALVMNEPGSIESRDLRMLDPIDRRYSILALRDPTGKVLVTRGGIDATNLPPIPDADSTNADQFVSVDVPTAQALIGTEIRTRMITHRFVLADGRTRYLDLIRATDMRREERTILVDVFVIGAVAGMLASVVAAWMLAGRAVAPLQELAERAGDVTPEHMETRFSLSSSGSSEVERLQSALNDALARMEEGYHAQERFISNVAHELKTPIAVMLAESQVMRAETTSREEIEGFRRSVIEEMQRLGSLVEGFLTLARATQQDRPPREEEVPINDLVIESVAACDAEADQYEVRLVPQLIESDDLNTPQVRGDPDLLCTMLNNLVRNAIRFSPPSEAVDIGVSLLDGQVRLAVRDRGPGVPEDQRERIFDRFVQVESDGSRGKGSGLGLAIAKGVVDLHGGSISVRNCEGGGCEFVVLLPLLSKSGGDSTQI